MSDVSGNGSERRLFYDLSQVELGQWLADNGATPYRERQIWSWAYRELVTDFESMRNLPLALRQTLAAEFTLDAAERVRTLMDQASHSRKDLLRLRDGQSIETVLMAQQYGNTVCVSSQVGCAMGCTMCATGLGGFVRDLSAGEIVYQAIHASRLMAAAGGRLTNVVFMGMGEPLLNFANTVRAIETLVSPGGLAISPQRITVSTVGLPERIVALASQPHSVRLAVSLHAPDDVIRRHIIPTAATVLINDIITACRTYARVTDSRITFEYVMIAGINDSVEQARQLVSLIGSLPAHVNLIPLNAVEGCPWQAPSLGEAERFREPFIHARIPVTIRVSKGPSIDAGCGQLRPATSNVPSRRTGAPPARRPSAPRRPNSSRPTASRGEHSEVKVRERRGNRQQH